MVHVGCHIPHWQTRLGLVFLLLVAVLAIGLFYFQCSQRRLEAMQNAAKSSYKGNQVHLVKRWQGWQKWQKIPRGIIFLVRNSSILGLRIVIGSKVNLKQT